MLVKELIKHTLWIPSKTYGQSQPEISVFLPTYSRGKSGLFKKAVHSILNQSFTQFELIIIDDGSIDGTKKQIEQLMQEDARISCLIHPNNLGLPAISEYEAFMKSTGKYIIFAFDDFIFEPNAFAALHEGIRNSNYHLCHGLANLHYLENNVEHTHVLGQLSTSFIEVTNTIPNAAVIVTKEILTKTGLYDPHIIMARICDWDLWIRIAKVSEIKKIDAIIGHEYGCTTTDSLGVLFHLNIELVRTYMAIDRTEQLLPQNYAEFDFYQTIDFLDDKTNFYIQQLLSSYTKKFWYESAIAPHMPKTTPPRKIIFYTSTSTNFNLCFAAFNIQEHNVIIRCVIHTSVISHDIQDMLEADLVIIDRELHLNLKLIKLLKALNIPCYYFIDDNFITLAKEDPLFGWYDKKNIAQALTDMDGVLTSTIALKNFFINEQLHLNALYWPPVVDKKLLANSALNKKPCTNRLNIAIVGGVFRKDHINQQILPVLNQLAQKYSITLYVRKGLITAPENYQISIHEFEYQINYSQFILYLVNQNINVLIHPQGKTENLPYKTNSILLTAYYINANIIVANEPAFNDLSEAKGIQKFSESETDLLNALTNIMDTEKAHVLKENLHAYCAKQFDQQKALLTLSSLLEQHQTSNYFTYEARNKAFISHLFNLLEKKELKLKEPDLPESTPPSVPTCKKNSNIRWYVVKYTLKSLWQSNKLTNTLAPSFQILKDQFLEKQANETTLRLKLGSLLNYKAFVEYQIQTPEQPFSSINIACEHAHGTTGKIGIEIVLPNGQIGAHVVQQINTINFNAPVTFTFPPIHLPQKSTLLVRVFATGLEAPMFTYEFHKKNKFYHRKRKSLFCTLS